MPHVIDSRAPARTRLSDVADFLTNKRFAAVGVSRNPRDFSWKLVREFDRRGYEVVLVNPAVPEIEGRKCFARIQDVTPPVDAVLLLTSPSVTEQVVRDCVAAGVAYVWMYRAGGPGATSPEAVAFCREHGIKLVAGECPFMYLPNAGLVHRVHGFLKKITGTYAT